MRPKRTWRRLVSLLDRREAGHLMGAGVVTAAVSLSAAIPAVLIGGAVDAAARHRNPVVALAIAAGLMAVRPVIDILRRRFAEKAAASLARRLRVRLVENLLRAEAESNGRSGDISTRVSHAVDGSVRFLKLMTLDAAPVVAAVVVAIPATLTTNALLGGLVLAVVPVSLYVTARQIRSEAQVRVGLENEKVQLDGTLVEQLHGMDAIRSLGAVNVEVERARRAAVAIETAEVAHHHRMALWSTAKGWVEAASQVAVAAVGVWLMQQGAATGGEVLAVVVLQATLLGPLREVHRIVDQSDEALVQAGHLLDFLDMPAAPRFRVQADLHARVARARTGGLDRPPLRFAKVTMAPAPGAAVRLREVDLDIRTNERVAITGPSGAGKSTLLRTAAGLLVPLVGEVSLWGVAVSSLDDRTLAELIGYLPQHPYLASGTVRDNLLLGWHDMSDASLMASLERLGLLEDTLDRGGLDAPVGEGGQGWSGGQRARLAMARLVLRGAPLLLLDEPTAGLDTKSADRVLEVTRGWHGTVVAVTHGSPEWADRVVHVTEGGILSAGAAASPLTV